MSLPIRRPALAAGSLALALTLAACGGTGTGTGSADPAAPSAESSTADSGPSGEVEVSTLDPRLVLTYDGGVMTLDTGSGEILDDVPLDGYLRVNQAGDGRHVLVTTPDGFQAYDTGLSAVPHGSHDHYYASDPHLSDLTFPAEHAGHAVVHDGVTALFADGTGEVTLLDPSRVTADGVENVGDVITGSWTAPEAHHGVAVPLPGDQLAVTVGTEEERSGVALLDADREQIAATDDCPGVHGEAAAQDDALVFGCENGPVVLAGGAFTKVEVDDEYARSGNLAGSHDSPIVLGDYKVDPDAELERPERVALIDTRDAGLQLVELGASYSFRSLGRGPDGEALVLTTDGALRVIDEETGEEIRRTEVVEPWEEPTEWQEARPALHVSGAIAYVTEPANRQVHAVDISSGEVLRSYDLPHVPDEVTAGTGFAPEHGGDEHEDHAAEDDEHSEGEESSGEHEGHSH
ncbi:zinc metallochaperone AztD [Georgenia halophila]|uniref:Zinc metallochaperone AztD n=1 Tax=Georgenia halophila TaxID=620889 RepID=A0ABP8LGU9_9MICO